MHMIVEDSTKIKGNWTLVSNWSYKKLSSQNDKYMVPGSSLQYADINLVWDEHFWHLQNIVSLSQPSPEGIHHQRHMYSKLATPVQHQSQIT
jgi:hypothetical protein